MSILLRAKNFLKSLFWHIYGGSKKCSLNEIEERFSICKTCELYAVSTSQCLKCGCNVNNKKVFMNKLAWADQSCPDGKWNKK